MHQGFSEAVRAPKGLLFFSVGRVCVVLLVEFAHALLESLEVRSLADKVVEGVGMLLVDFRVGCGWFGEDRLVRVVRGGRILRQVLHKDAARKVGGLEHELLGDTLGPEPGRQGLSSANEDGFVLGRCHGGGGRSGRLRAEPALLRGARGNGHACGGGPCVGLFPWLVLFFHEVFEGGSELAAEIVRAVVGRHKGGTAQPIVVEGGKDGVGRCRCRMGGKRPLVAVRSDGVLVDVVVP
mmetsp:Transcript_16110/g.33334  ORF Transcript_16110/g.33334 Transcript_16110/m.33334 type:complete len:238 (-) Transcript_16110:275-988(-)